MLYNSKVIAGMELSLSSWCIASLYICHFWTVIDFSSEKFSGSTGHRNSCTSRQIYSEDGEGEDRTRNTWITNPVLQPLSYTAQKLLLGRSWVYPIGVLHHSIFLISQLWLTSHPRSTVVLLDTEGPGTSREFYRVDEENEPLTRKPFNWKSVL